MPFPNQVQQLVDRFRPRPLPIVPDCSGDDWGRHKAVQADALSIANKVELHAVGGIIGSEQDCGCSADIVVPADNGMEISLPKQWQQLNEQLARGCVDSQIEIRCYRPLGDDICAVEDGEPHPSIPQQVERLSGECWTSGCYVFPWQRYPSKCYHCANLVCR